MRKTVLIKPLKTLQVALPEYASPGAAALDLRANIEGEYTLYPGEVFKCPTGFALGLNEDVAALILPRSGIGSMGLNIANGTGLIDCDYQGEVFMMFYNRSDIHITITRGHRVAQLMFIPAIHADMYVVSEFEQSTLRGDGGFGSTGDK